IGCDLRPGVIHTAHRARLAPAFKAEVEHLARGYGYETGYLDRPALRDLIDSPAYHAAIIDPGAAHIHPLNYALGLARAAAGAGVRVYEMSEATAIERGARPVVRTNAGAVSADHVLLACNGYLGGLAPEIAARVMPINNFIIATEPLAEDRARSLIGNDMAVADSKFVVNYYRLSADRRLLFGGRESYGYRFPVDIKGFVRKAMLEIYPQLADARIDYGWGGTLAITMNRMPHLARLGPAILSASGYSGHGVAMATLAGKLAAEAIAGQAEKFDLLAAVPSPRFPGGARLRSPLLALAMLWYSLRDRI
ncbi:MAG: FAD-binding oxidoreductase, partial [Paracoccaceae bacterium]